jgi:hypothetical protein
MTCHAYVAWRNKTKQCQSHFQATVEGQPSCELTWENSLLQWKDLCPLQDVDG